MVPGIKHAGAKRTLHRHGKNAKACVPFAITQIATQRLRLRFGKEEQGSGRMASFLSKDKKDAGAKRTLHRHGKNAKACVPFAITQIATQRLRLRFGKEEQGSGRMASFFVQRQKKTPEQSGLCSDVVRERRLELPRLLSHAPQTCLSTGSSTLAAGILFYASIIITAYTGFVNRIFCQMEKMDAFSACVSGMFLI